MATKREYLISLGLAKEGRGKFSNDGKVALDKAIAGGMTFDDVVTNAPQPKVKADKPLPVTDGPVEDDNILFDSERPNYGKRWHGIVNGKRIEVSERAACGNCHYSLIGHVCNTPEALTSKGVMVAVTASG